MDEPISQATIKVKDLPADEQSRIVQAMIAKSIGEREIARITGLSRHAVRKEFGRAGTVSGGLVPTAIPVNRAHQNAHARPLREGHIVVLVESIKQIDLIEPIVVRRLADGFEIIAGGHRTAAFQRLGRETIPAIVIDVDDLTAELMLIDENLIREDLSAAERSIALRRRKVIYEELHPETKHGSTVEKSRSAEGAFQSRKVCDSGETKSPDKPTDNVSRETAIPRANPAHAAATPRVERFTAGTAKATGISERAVQLAVKRANVIGDSSLKRIIGTSLDKGEELDALAKVSVATRDVLIERAAAGEKVTAKTAVKQEIRAAREADLGSKIAAGNLTLPDRKFAIILCDWPRKPRVWSDETGMDRAPDNHYATQTFRWAIDELAPMVQKLAAPDAMLVFWTTAASLIDDIEIMTEAGFCALRPRDAHGRLIRNGMDGEPLPARSPLGGTYRSHQIWDKEVRGTGRWFIERHELILLGVRGKIPCPAPGTQSLSIFNERRGEPSAKPEFVAAEIDRLWPSLPKIEMFRRGAPRPGWEAWGSDAIVDPHPSSPGIYGDSPVLAPAAGAGE